ncbi:hypothetical protein [Halobellus rufus]|uniref:hypothetical protein n=1 Tax=Halobellus rufus TaxID=1448860 RepID=UPI000679B174|nr:hypothetical protein [Halobellus rufus]
MSDDAAERSDSNADLDDVIEQFLRDVDAAHDDYDRGYTDADATLGVVMNHVETLREVHENSD